ncbi:hypothetical protein QQ045_025409 [Rhodiola kirilowii]
MGLYARNLYISVVFMALVLCSFGETARLLSAQKSDQDLPHLQVDHFTRESGNLNSGGIKYFSSTTLEGIKEGGPSPGEGNKYTDSRPLSASLKDSGPSPGIGH